jgi:hypothetical protein
MKSKSVIIIFDEVKEELNIIIGNEKLVIPGFVRDSSGEIHQAVLSAEGQEKVIKKLVANITLVDIGWRA